MKASCTAWFLAVGVATLACVSPTRAHAQQADVTMSVDRSEAAAGEPILLEIRVNATNGRVDSITPPDLGRFTVVGHEEVRPMQFTFSFGHTATVAQSTVVSRYRLVAKQNGRVELAPARASVGGHTFRSNSLVVVIRDAGQVPPDQANPVAPAAIGQPEYTPPSGTLDGAHFDRTAFLRTVVDKPNAVVGEQVTATLYLYVHGALGSSPEVSREATTDGFWVHDLTPRDDRDLTSEQTAGGVRFRVYLLKRMALFPLRAGTLTIGAMRLSAQTAMGFDTWGIAQPEAFDREGVPVAITVRDLPAEGRPPGAAAYVGSYTIESHLDRPQAATGDAVTLTCVVRGSGNMRELHVELPTIPGLNALAPQIRDEVNAPADLVGGTRTFEWLLVPQRAGTYTIPALGFSVYDVASGHYARVAAPSLTLVAAGNAIAGTAPVEDRTTASNTPPAERVTFGPIRATSEFLRAHASIARAKWFGFALIAPPALWLMLALVRLVQRRARANSLQNAPKRAVKGAKKRLTKADALAQAGDARSFYTEVARAMKEVLEARIGEQVGGFTHAQLRQFLLARGMQEELATRIIEELEGGDFARFSATGSSLAEMTQCRERVEALLQRIDKFTPVVTEGA